MNDEKRTWRRVPVAIGAALALTGGAIAVAAFPGVASAGGQAQSATAAGECDGEDGFIVVEIIDDFSTTYDVFIDGELVDEDITDTDGQVIAYGPFADGVYNVEIVAANEATVLDTDVEIECAAEVTTTVAPTTTIAVADATATAPAFTG